MKQIKFYCVVISAAALLYGCERESLNLPEEEAAAQDKMKFSEFVNSGVDVDQYINNVLANELKSRSHNKSHSDVSYEEALFNEYCDELAVEGFEKGEINPENAGIFKGPLNENTCCHKFDTRDILPGISVSAEEDVLGFYGQLVRGTESKVIYAQNEDADLFINFTADDVDVNSVGLDILSFPYPNSEETQQVTVEVYSDQGELIHTEIVDASISGTFWAISGDDNISQITLSSTNDDAWIGVDNIAFGSCISPDADWDGCLDEDDADDESNFEATVHIGSCDSGVLNRSTSECGMNLSDLVDEVEAGEYKNKGQFIQAVAHATNEWLSADLISPEEKDAIVNCAADAGQYK